MFNVRTFILLFLALATTKVAGFGSMHTEDERASRALTLPPSLDDAVNPKICNQAQPEATAAFLAGYFVPGFDLAKYFADVPRCRDMYPRFPGQDLSSSCS